MSVRLVVAKATNSHPQGIIMSRRHAERGKVGSQLHQQYVPSFRILWFFPPGFPSVLLSLLRCARVSTLILFCCQFVQNKLNTKQRSLDDISTIHNYWMFHAEPMTISGKSMCASRLRCFQDEREKKMLDQFVISSVKSWYPSSD